ncbi:MAG: Cof-type HAD-IIB family hydrolase [Gaiella sp.]
MSAFAVDLDGTLVGRDGLLPGETRAAIARSRAAGIPVLVATGRMYRSVLPYIEQAGISELVICYQGSVVADPTTSEFLLHRQVELELAREAIVMLEGVGQPPNVYVDDELFVGTLSDYAQGYATYQRLPVTEVGDLVAWLDRPPTKLVVIAEPDELPPTRALLGRRFGDSIHLTTSLPWMLELSHPQGTKGAGLAFVAAHLGIPMEEIVAFGDGENDLELLETAGFGIAVGDAHERLLEIADWTCPGPDELGVAGVVNAVLDLLA